MVEKPNKPGLQECRKAAGWKSAREFAEHFGVSYNTYMAWEQGRHSIDIATAWELADDLNCSIDEIAGRSTVNYAYVEIEEADDEA